MSGQGWCLVELTFRRGSKATPLLRSKQVIGRLPGLTTGLPSIWRMTSPATMPDRARLVGSRPALAAAELGVTA